MSGVIVIASAILAFSLVSGRLKEKIITPPMAFAAFGLAVGGAGLGLVEIDISHSTIHVLAEITLVLILFSDAARIDLQGRHPIDDVSTVPLEQATGHASIGVNGGNGDANDKAFLGKLFFRLFDGRIIGVCCAASQYHLRKEFITETIGF